MQISSSIQISIFFVLFSNFLSAQTDSKISTTEVVSYYSENEKSTTNELDYNYYLDEIISPIHNKINTESNFNETLSSFFSHPKPLISKHWSLNVIHIKEMKIYTKTKGKVGCIQVSDDPKIRDVKLYDNNQRLIYEFSELNIIHKEGYSWIHRHPATRVKLRIANNPEINKPKVKIMLRDDAPLIHKIVIKNEDQKTVIRYQYRYGRLERKTYKFSEEPWLYEIINYDENGIMLGSRFIRENKKFGHLEYVRL